MDEQAEQDYYDALAEDDYATWQAEYGEWTWQQAWQSHLAELVHMGEVAAEDPAINWNPSAIDCRHFDYESEATAFYHGAGGPQVDLFWLDEDRDGWACELLPDPSVGDTIYVWTWP